MTAALTLRDGIAALREAGIEDAPRDARLLMARAMSVPADRLTLHLQDQLTDPMAQAFADLVKARAARQPMAQILGERLFWGRSFEVTRDTLDPRPETEVLVQEALRKPFLNVLDLGTGSGCILISCLMEMPQATGLGTDLSDAALRVAARNAARHSLSRAKFASSDWFRSVDGQFDLIVANPPYIAAAEMTGLAPEVRNWEPKTALTPGGDGLSAYRAIAAGASAHLQPGGRILLEIGPTQGAAVSALLKKQGLTGLRILPDLDGRDRVVCAQKPASGSAADGTHNSAPVAT
ncbi:MAG: peptide chain release factor N(5)-glutamine methyltransferase [Cypionkella sp.]